MNVLKYFCYLKYNQVVRCPRKKPENLMVKPIPSNRVMEEKPEPNKLQLETAVESQQNSPGLLKQALGGVFTQDQSKLFLSGVFK